MDILSYQGGNGYYSYTLLQSSSLADGHIILSGRKRELIINKVVIVGSSLGGCEEVRILKKDRVRYVRASLTSFR